MRDLKPHYTDLFVFVGLTLREAQVDLRDRMRNFPENYLGYRIRVLTMSTALEQVRGIRVAECEMSSRCWEHPDAPRVADYLRFARYTHPLHYYPERKSHAAAYPR